MTKVISPSTTLHQLHLENWIVVNFKHRISLALFYEVLLIRVAGVVSKTASAIHVIIKFKKNWKFKEPILLD